MSVPQIRLKTKDFRAIANADIIIDGITIVAGENGSGKSTLSKLLYFVFKTACNYEKLVEAELRKELSNVERFLKVVIHDISFFLDPKNENNLITNESTVKKLRGEFSLLENELTQIWENENILSTEVVLKWAGIIEKIKLTYFEIAGLQKYPDSFITRSTRIIYILSDLMNEDLRNKKLTPELFEKVNNSVQTFYDNAFNVIKLRPVTFFDIAVSKAFKSINSLQLEVAEYGTPIFKTGIGNLSDTYSILNAIYTDTPMSIGVNNSGYDYWDDLNDLLLIESTGQNAISNFIGLDIINGEATVNFDVFSRKAYAFKRSDGAVFNLLDCATGIKSFAVLQILLNNGSLNDKTLLIIDEPEVHLHPKWIVEYARIIVMLNKEMGIKFFIASHDPDFISAIRYISEKEGNLDKVNFYLAEKAGDTFTYNYTHLQHNIDPIFKSFNIAISKIEEYGA